MSKPTLKPSPPARGGAQAAAAVARGLLSLTVLAALLVGLPILLWWATTIVGPPGAAALGSLFSTDDSGQVFLLALAVAGWVGWVLFACAVLLEIPAQLRGRAAPQIRGLVGQRAAATLVGAVLLALPTTTALAAPATAVPAAPPTSASASAVPTPTPATTARPEGETTRSAYTVRDLRPAESLWSIAEQTLGDGQRWEEIAALNEGRTMTDGSIFRTEHPIQPGWLLTLPTAADTAGMPAQGTATGPGGDTGTEYSVRQGDSLTSIAADQLGNADRYTEIFELNRGKALPDGAGTFTDPDLIHPGQRLALPGTGRPPAAEPPTAAPGTAPAAPAPATTATAPAPSASSPDRRRARRAHSTRQSSRAGPRASTGRWSQVSGRCWPLPSRGRWGCGASCSNADAAPGRPSPRTPNPHAWNKLSPPRRNPSASSSSTPSCAPSPTTPPTTTASCPDYAEHACPRPKVSRSCWTNPPKPSPRSRPAPIPGPGSWTLRPP